MRPRSELRGNPAESKKEGTGLKASMRPRSELRGNATTEIDFKDGEQSFNEAAQ